MITVQYILNLILSIFWLKRAKKLYLRKNTEKNMNMSNTETADFNLAENYGIINNILKKSHLYRKSYRL